MCYMGAKAVPRLAQVGVRELRQNLSVYLRRIKQGERLEVTEHGRLVALLVPPPATDSVLDRLVAAGLATRATRDIRDLPPPLPLRSGERPASEILQEMRDEDDR
jgi:prevent-host-death family protein